MSCAPAPLPVTCRYHIDQWKAYAKGLSAHHRPYPRGSGKTNVVEAINCSLLQCYGPMFYNSCSIYKLILERLQEIKAVD